MAERPGSGSAAGPSSGKGKGKKRASQTDQDQGEGSGVKRARMAEQEAGASQMANEEWLEGSWETLPGVETNGEATSSQAHDESQSEEYFDAPSQQRNELCPIIDKDTKPFRLMDLPTELRIEIYRACLTRPFDVLLARNMLPVEKALENEEVEEGDFDETELSDDVWQAQNNPPAGAPAGLIPVSAAGPVVAPSSHNTNASPLRSLPSSIRSAAARSARSVRSFGRSSARVPTINAMQPQNQAQAARPRNAAQTNGVLFRSNATTRARRLAPASETQPQKPRAQAEDPLIVNILRTNKTIYKEARNILYGENAFLLDLDNALPTLSALHQRSRGQIRNLRVTIPTHNEILERFAEVVRLSLRYCWRLQKFYINMPFVLPGADGSGTSGNTTVYANAFDILRWLPRQCEVVLEGNVCEEIRAVVDRNANLAKNLDEVRFALFFLFSIVLSASACVPASLSLLFA